MDAKDLIVPIRVRGAVRTREEQLARAFSGALSRRGNRPEQLLAQSDYLIFRATPFPRQPLKIPIPRLIEELRHQSGSVPLSVIVYGWGGREAAEFVSMLRRHLRDEDALVLLPIPSRGIGASAMQAPEGSVLMNLNHPSHKRMYENGSLIADVVFMSDADTSEIEKWKSSVRAVIVSQNAPSAEAVLAAAREMDRVGYLWNGEHVQLDES
jgi:hypothetical protein